MTLLQDVVQQNLNYSRQQKVIFDVYITRWIENFDGYNQFLQAYPYIVKVLEVISHKLHLKKYPNWRQWDTESKRTTSALLAGIATFEFCIVWTTVVRSLFYLRGSTKKIQEQSLDLLDVLGQVEVAREDLAFIRNGDAKEYFSRCFEYAVEIASLIDILPSMPRISACQQHREDAESDTPFSYYRNNMCLPFS